MKEIPRIKRPPRRIRVSHRRAASSIDTQKPEGKPERPPITYPDPPAAWYQFTSNRKGEHPSAHLASYKGWMHADGYAGFNDLYRSAAISEVACMAHIRRKFLDVFQS